MKIKEKRYIKKCDCGTEIIYTRRDCRHDTTWDTYKLCCPSCDYEYKYRNGVYHNLFDEEYEEDSVDKNKEIERLNNIINEFENWLISWIENEQYCFMANNPKDRCRREIYEEVLHHFKELKGSNDNE